MSCPNCPVPSSHRQTGHSGPSPCDVMFIAGMPGSEEDDKPDNYLFTGYTGKEFNEHFLREAGLTRREIYFTNALKCCREKKPSDKEILSCAATFLPDEIRECQPQVIVLLGAQACSLIHDISVDIQHGIPEIREIMGYKALVVPMYHPSLAVREPGKIAAIREDFQRLKDIVNNPLKFDEHLKVYKNLIASKRVKKDRFDCKHFDGAVDIETQSGKLWSIQIYNSVDITTSFIRMDAPAIVERFKSAIQPKIQLHNASDVIFHNAVNDLPYLRPYWNMDNITVTDTMQMAYNLGLPQSLKTLAYRLSGIKMQSYNDVVMPWSLDKLKEWIAEAICFSYEGLSTVTINKKGKLITKSHKINTDLNRIFNHADSDTYNPWEKLEALNNKYPLEISRIREYAGNVPEPGVVNVPESIMIDYGCLDAEITWLVYGELNSLLSIKYIL